MKESDLEQVEALERDRPNGRRVTRVMRDLFFSSTDPMAPIRLICAVLATALITVGSVLVLIVGVLD